MNTLDRLGSKTRFIAVRPAQVIDKALHRVNVQNLQLDGAQGWLDMDPDVFVIGLDCQRLHTAQVIPLPDIQPLAHGHL